MRKEIKVENGAAKTYVAPEAEKPAIKVSKKKPKPKKMVREMSGSEAIQEKVSDELMAAKAAVAAAIARRVRHGKTRRDRANGTHSRNRANKEARGNWINECRGKPNARFPSETLGGKGNSSLHFKMVAGRGRVQRFKATA